MCRAGLETCCPQLTSVLSYANVPEAQPAAKTLARLMLRSYPGRLALLAFKIGWRWGLIIEIGVDRRADPFGGMAIPIRIFGVGHGLIGGLIFQ